ncbi:MAG: hypothetical protein AB7Q29_16045 [Vicinamibacterales bacterium]
MANQADTPLHWKDLPAAAREELARVIALLALERFTGDIVLECAEGGIRRWHEKKTHERRNRNA